MKSIYWSCSKFANWLRGTPKPHVGTTEEWSAWEKTAKTKKVRYWLAEEGLDYLQDFIRWPFNRINDVRCYIDNRWVVKTHALSSKLNRGKWHDLDTRMLHAVFDELVNFVEIEQAWMFVVCSEAEERKKYKTPWYRTFFRFSLWRCPDAGFAHLERASTLKNNEEWNDKNSPDYGQPTIQAIAAQEILALYKWWKWERPKRVDPSEASGWSEFCKENRKAAKACGDDLGSSGRYLMNREDDECSLTILSTYRDIIKRQEHEDTAMLIRLVKIRRSLWT